MNIRLHKNATTTPARRAYIQSSSASVAQLARELGVSEDTIRRWRGRESVEDRSHSAQRLQTTLSPGQEAVVVALRQTLGLPLDDLLVVTREFVCAQATRSGLHRLLKRRGLSRLPPEAKTQTPAKPFKAYEPGYLHLDVKYLPQLADETERRYLFVAIDRATRWVFIQLAPAKSAAAAKGFLAAPRARLSDPHHQDLDRQRRGVHRSALRLAGACAQRQPPARSALPSPGHRASAHQAPNPPDQRHGGTLQRPYRRTPQNPSLHQRRRPPLHPGALRLALQPPPAPEGARSTLTYRSDETLVHSTT